MVKITNGINTYDVTKGAFETIFKAQGYTKVEEEVQNDNGNASADDNGEGKISEDEKFLSELEEKPISQWSKAEVKKYVDLKGINTEGASTLAEVKELIKATIS